MGLAVFLEGAQGGSGGVKEACLAIVLDGGVDAQRAVAAVHEQLPSRHCVTRLGRAAQTRLRPGGRRPPGALAHCPEDRKT
jgi:hypothetical protein